jgi:hypothetical protein
MNNSPYRDGERPTPQGMSELLAKFTTAPKEKPARGIHSADHELAGRIVKELKDTRPRAFGIWLGIIKRHGHWKVSTALGSVMDSKAKSPAKLLMWKLKNKDDGQARPGVE